MSFNPIRPQLRRPGTVLFSDMDGTLIGPDKRISPANQMAIRQLVDAGGSFSVATGRTASIAAPFVEELPLTLPAIVFNGAAVYDYRENRYLHQWNLPAAQARAILEVGLAAYPTACAQICRTDSLTLINRDCMMDRYILEENQDFIFDEVDDCTNSLKVMLWGEHDALERAQAAIIQAGLAEGVHQFFSSPYYLEFLPNGVNKGSALEWICAEYGIAHDHLAAIGDYDNDIELLQLASLAACPGNASPAARAHASVMVADHAHDAVADLIWNHLLDDTSPSSQQ